MVVVVRCLSGQTVITVVREFTSCAAVSRSRSAGTTAAAADDARTGWLQGWVTELQLGLLPSPLGTQTPREVGVFVTIPEEFWGGFTTQLNMRELTTV